eukprot:gene3540-7039_t
MLRDIMRGDLGRLLSTLHRRSLGSTSSCLCSLVHSMTTAHLALLLDKGNDGDGGSGGGGGLLLLDDRHHNPTDSDEEGRASWHTHIHTHTSHGGTISLSEELLLHAMEILADCPIGTKVVADMLECYLGSLTSPVSRNCASTLLSRLPCVTDSEVIAVASSLRRLGLGSEASILELRRGTWWLRQGQSQRHSVCYGGSGMEFQAKAMYFFHQSGQLGVSRCEALLEQSLIRCMRVVAGCGLFHDLSPVFINCYFNAQQSGDTSQEALKSILLAVDDLLAPGPFPHCVFGDWLDKYRRAVNLFIQAMAGDGNGNGNGEDDVALIHQSQEMLMSMLLGSGSGSGPSVVVATPIPVRFWPHLMDVILWLNTHCISVVMARDKDRRCDHHRLPDSSPLPMSDREGVLRPVQVPQQLASHRLSRARVLQLMLALEQLETTVALPSSRSHSVPGESSLLASIRSRLLQSFSYGVIADNAATGKRRAARLKSSNHLKFSQTGGKDVSLCSPMTALLRAPTPSFSS